MGRVPGRGRGFEDHVGALEGASGHPSLWVKGHRTGWERFLLLGAPPLLPDNLIEGPRGRRGRGGAVTLGNFP